MITHVAVKFYLNYLIISINSFLDADLLWYQPNTIPINVETQTASKIEPRLTTL